MEKRRKRFLFDTSVIINYLRGEETARDAFILFEGKGYITLLTYMEICLGNKPDEKIRKEILSLNELSERWNFKQILIPTVAQKSPFNSQRMP